MGFTDAVRKAGEQRAAEKATRDEVKSAARPHYLCSVNKGSVNMAAWQQQLNEAWSNGYRLHTAFEQAGNTVQILERREDADSQGTG